MFDVNFINEPGMQDVDINKKLNYYNKEEETQGKEIVPNRQDNTEVKKAKADSSSIKNTNIVPLIIIALLTLYVAVDYIGVLPKQYSFIDNIINSNGKVVNRDSNNIYKIAEEYVDIISSYNNVSGVILNNKNITLHIDYDNILKLEEDRWRMLKDYDLTSSNVFVKRGSGSFSIIISSQVMINNDGVFFPDDSKNVGIISGMSKIDFISFMRDMIKSKNILSSNLDVLIINKENQSIIIPR